MPLCWWFPVTSGSFILAQWADASTVRKTITVGIKKEKKKSVSSWNPSSTTSGPIKKCGYFG
jgi:hypothetical protein